jgi:uncharacterized coiled-coil protein SlyX
MRNPAIPLLVVALLLLGGASAWLLVQNRDSKLAYQDLSAAEESSRQSYNRTLDAIAEIQDSLDSITPRDSAFQVVPGSLATEQEMAGPDSRRALEHIAQLRASIERNRERIRQLEATLAKEGEHVAGLRRMVANLNRDLGERQRAIDEMSARVEALQNQVVTLETEVQQGRDTLVVREATLEDRRRELATVQCLVGTKKELTAQGAVVAKGGLLGIGKTLMPTGHLPEGAGIVLDTDVSTVVRTDAAKARVLTPQPASSYELKVVDGRVELHILDPEAFRKVRQLVIVTA